MKSIDRFALLLSLITFFIAVFIAYSVYENIPHIEDEIAYVWQARLAATGNLFIETPTCPECFLEPFIIDKDGLRFGKYPPGWPAVLSIGTRLGIRNLVNPFFAAFFVWLNYLLVKKLLDAPTALLATILVILSPFFLMNSANLLGHAWSLLLAVIFSHAWLDMLNPKRNMPLWLHITCGILSMGLLILTRPMTAFAVCVPFFIHGCISLLKGTWTQRRTVLLLGSGILIMAALYLLWQKILTGDFFTNPYTLYWYYDRIGFGKGVGLHPDGHQLRYAWFNTKFSLGVGLSDLFGWIRISWIFIPFGFIAIRKNKNALLISSIFFSLVLVYALYWIGSWLFGPRYYFEGIFSLTLLTAAGIRWLAGNFPVHQAVSLLTRIRFIAVYASLLILIIGNIGFYLPTRVGGLRGLYGINSAQLTPFYTSQAQELTPALVIVRVQKNWLEYGALLDLSNPTLDSPFIFTYDRGDEKNAAVIAAFPDRRVIRYFTGKPYEFLLIK